MASSFLSMVRFLADISLQLARAGSEQFQKMLFKRFRQPGLNRQDPGVVRRKAMALHRILGRHHQPFKSTGCQVFGAKMMMVGKGNFIHVGAKVPEGFEKSTGITNTRYCPYRLAFELLRRQGLTGFQVHQSRRHQLHGMNLRMINAGKTLYGLSGLRKLSSVKNDKVDTVQALNRLPQRAYRNDGTISGTTPGIEYNQFDIPGQAVVLQAIITDQHIAQAILQRPTGPSTAIRVHYNGASGGPGQ